MLETAVDYYQQFINRWSGDPTAQADLKTTQNQVESLLADLAVMRQAFRHMLLREPEVERDLGITEEQHNKLISLFQDMKNRGEGPKGDPPQRPGRSSKDLLPEMKAHETGLARILTEAQQSRLKQIDYRARGINVFQEPEVIAALQLTKEQREELKELCWREPHGFRGGPGGGRGGPGRGKGPPRDAAWDGPSDGPKGSRPAPPQLRRGGRPDMENDWHEAMAILTPEQRERWNELAGPKFTMRFAGMRGRRPGSFDH
jgi:eukaryotic-like serine/threonine-protein kinase